MTDDVRRRLLDGRLVAILRLRDHRHAVDVGRALVAGGVEAMEVTVDHPDGPATIAALCDALGDDALVGAGTVRTAEQVRAVAEAGARFVVAPDVVPEVIAASLDAGLEPLPGAASPTEVFRAVDLGARLVKLFPAGPLGIDYLRALRGPVGETAQLIPTGGIAHDEVGAWLAAGAAAVGLGSDLVPARPGPGDLAGIERRAAVAVQQARAGS